MGTLKRVTDSSKDNWDQFLPAASYAYRMSNQASRNTTHSFLYIADIQESCVTFEINQDIYCGVESGGEERENGDSDVVLERLLEI